VNIRIVPFTLVLLVLGLCAAASPQAQAGLAVSNLSNTFGSAWDLGSGSTLADSPVANQFTTGPGPGWTLDSVVLDLGLVAGTPSGSISAFLAADNSGLPGTTLVTLLGSNPTTPSEDITFTPQSPTLLAVNTAYWLVVSANLADNYLWNFTTDTSETGLPGWSIGNTSYAGYPSGTWTALASSVPPFNVPAPVLFQVNATAVPEPGSLTLLAMGGVVGLAGAASRRRKRIASGA